jgi:hypothetical protein
MTTPPVWVRCLDCNLLLNSPATKVGVPDHPNSRATGVCRVSAFETVKNPGQRRRATARAELARRLARYEKAREARKERASQPAKVQTKVKGKNSLAAWDGVRATSARPIRGTAGSPGLGKRS